MACPCTCGNGGSIVYNWWLDWCRGARKGILLKYLAVIHVESWGSMTSKAGALPTVEQRKCPATASICCPQESVSPFRFSQLVPCRVLCVNCLLESDSFTSGGPFGMQLSGAGWRKLLDILLYFRTILHPVVTPKMSATCRSAEERVACRHTHVSSR